MHNQTQNIKPSQIQYQQLHQHQLLRRLQRQQRLHQIDEDSQGIQREIQPRAEGILGWCQLLQGQFYNQHHS